MAQPVSVKGNPWGEPACIESMPGEAVCPSLRLNPLPRHCQELNCIGNSGQVQPAHCVGEMQHN